MKLAKDATKIQGKMEQARQILEQLQQKDLPVYQNQDAEIVLLLAKPLLTAQKGLYGAVKRILDNRVLPTCARTLSKEETSPLPSRRHGSMTIQSNGHSAHRESQSTANSRTLRICHRDGTAD
jgi:hypothetical protein